MSSGKAGRDPYGWDPEEEDFFDGLEEIDATLSNGVPILQTCRARVGLSFVVSVFAYVCVALWADGGAGTVSVLLALPFTLGFFFGRLYDSTGIPSVARMILASLNTFWGVIAGIIFLGTVGPICGLMLLGFGMTPFVLGALTARACRRRPPQSRDGRRDPFLWLLVGTFAAHQLEIALLPPPPTVSQTTSIILDATPTEVFDALVFYEDCDHPAPLWFSIGFPRPVGPATPAKEMGSEQLCHFHKGWVRKQFDVWERGEALEFAVLDHEIGFERSVRLLRGGYRLEPVAGGTRLAATTVYRAKLTVRFVWAPIERVLCRDFHEYLLEGVRLNLERQLFERGLPLAKRRTDE